MAVSAKFAKNEADLLVKFLQVMNDSTKVYHETPEATYADIGKMAGITPEKTKDIMSAMGFYQKDTQLSMDWMGTSSKPGATAANLKKVADFLVQQGALDKAKDDYGQFIDTSFLEQVK